VLLLAYSCGVRQGKVAIALFQTSCFVEYGLTLAACVICTLPALAAFLVLQRQIIEGIVLTGLKD
jgi:ABC-type glycerol-3-phosphate transport system permease component